MGGQEAVGVLRRARGPRQGFWEGQGKGQAQQPSRAPEPWELCALRVLFPHIHTSCPASSFHSNSPFKTQLQGLQLSMLSTELAPELHLCYSPGN